MSAIDTTDTVVVLVVEDEILIREDMIDVLEREGFEALRASNVREALAVLDRRKDIRAVFTDIQMPGERDGLDLARHLAEQRPEAAVLVTSGRSVATPDGLPPTSAFVPKPYMPRRVAGLLREMVGGPPSRPDPGRGRTLGAGSFAAAQ